MIEKKILVVDDEQDLCEILQFNLQAHGFNVEVANSAEQALKKPLETFDLLLLDVMMEDISGFELLKMLREDKNVQVPVVFITAMTSEESLLYGFEIGADDYIKKPFSISEVIARINAVMDRSPNKKLTEEANQLVNLDDQQKRLFINKEPVELTKTEYDIFQLLFEKPGKVYSREDIMKKIYEDQQGVLGRTIDVNITRIRKKLGEWGKCIATRSGYGYYYNNKVAYPLVN